MLVVLIQFLICLVAAVVQTIWARFNAAGHWYLDLGQDDSSVAMQSLITFGTWFVNMMNLVPIALIVTLEMVKFIQAYFINQDVTILDQERDIETQVQSSNLNEELGMVHFVFSDKTGTLTQNIMEFKKFSAGDTSYGVDDPAVIDYAPGITNVDFQDNKLTEHLDNAEHPNHEPAKKFIKALGICHTVIPEEKVAKDGEKYIIFNGSSPDELALVNGARHLGFKFICKDEDNNMVINSWDGQLKYELLNVFQFDSDRKRMSVIVKTPEDKIMIVCKGADSIMEKRLAAG